MHVSAYSCIALVHSYVCLISRVWVWVRVGRWVGGMGGGDLRPPTAYFGKLAILLGCSLPQQA